MATQPPLVPGLSEITQPFLLSCASLAPGQLVKSQSLGMLDAMNALTVMDPRMDAGVVRGADSEVPWIQQEEEEEGMTVHELCAMIDRLVENESQGKKWLIANAHAGMKMLFNTGWPLVPTVFTSRHFRLLPSLRLRRTPFPSTITNNDLFHTIFLPYLEAYNLSLAYVWSELVTKLATYEGEDWMGDTAGLWAEGEEFGVGVGAEDVEDVLRGLMQVQEAVEAREIEGEGHQTRQAGK
ncbi:hypothetical protein QFC21_000649 [Naganishia friedmannii]|uniref:Uncharacterized protein n=1 Tax=Naganishia friedmannii TaxID=89922 RepID=A0ACC2WDV6_9TREE|nr:hypothetical protein QFC21_000649 [Naganishia friedmannii]